MPKNGYYITSDGRKFTLESQQGINVPNRNIIELVIPDGVTAIICNNNQLTSLNFPRGMEFVYCDNNQLTSLKIPSSIKRIHCDVGLVNVSDYINNNEINLYVYF